MIIEVTAEDIRKGIKKRRHCCPVALALCRSFPGCKEVDVGRLTARIEIRCEPGSILVNLPTNVINFTTKFDVGCDVEPFSFELEVSHPA